MSRTREHRISKPEKVLEVKREDGIQEIRNQLLELKRQLLTDAGEAINTIPDNILYPDLGDQASAEIDRNFMLRLRGREQKLLKKIEVALDKIDDGTYGKCELCGNDIGIRRLKARPVTTLCIECKTEQEEEEKFRDEMGV
ncbi:MAG: RNA polymerase-binding protein DksA [Candidatus Magnetoovum sp. WYHC-5]|nr:RNA polymerase-binding protein DksA [Candidatus Magnetoovum sp. WYHC-5]